jgi:hypothetical protein
MRKTCVRCEETKPITEWSAYNAAISWGWCKACWRDKHRARYAPKSGDDEPRDCASCGSSYRPKARQPSIYCSRACKDTTRNAARQAAIEASKPHRECLHCGSVLPQAMRSNAIFCSVKCNMAAHALQRKLRVRGHDSDGKPGYLRAAVCKRDRWRCGICREKVNPSLRHPHPRCASLDHVVPVSQGGGNESANLRLTHLVCNLSRRNVGGGEQLALI